MGPSAAFTMQSLGWAGTRPLGHPSTSLPLHRAHSSLRWGRKPTLSRAQGDASEKFWSVAEVLREAEDMGASEFLFEDVSEEPVWQHEQRITAQPLDFKTIRQKVEVKGALKSDDADILSAYSSEQGFQEVTVEALHKQLGSVFILDVRTPQEFSAGHVPSATNIPLDALSDAVRKGCLDAVREQTVAVICASGGRSAQATVRLSRVFGFPNVVNVTGGTNQWIGSGMPIEQGA